MVFGVVSLVAGGAAMSVVGRVCDVVGKVESKDEVVVG
jgi:hypothetical protein